MAEEEADNREMRQEVVRAKRKVVGTSRERLRWMRDQVGLQRKGFRGMR